MTNPNIRIKRSAVPGKRPSNSQMELGELALNTNDGRLFTKKENVGIGTTVTLLNVWTENVGGGAYYNDGNIGIGTTNPITGLTISGKISTGDEIDNPNIASVLNVNVGSGIAGNRPINLIDSAATIKIARITDTLTNDSAIEFQTWNSGITSNTSYWDIYGGFYGMALRDRFTGRVFNRLFIDINGNILIGSTNSNSLNSSIEVRNNNLSNTLQVQGNSYFSGNIGIGTTVSTSKLHVIGDELVTGVVTATAFNGNINAGFGTITNLSSTNISNSGIITTTNLAVNTGFDVYATTSTFHDNVVIQGDLTVNGTQVILNVDEKYIKDKQIVLGFSTTNNVTDTTANGGGFGIASTEGSPLVCLQCTGINTLPGTYKQLIWTKANTFGAGTTDAFLFNYAVGVGSTLVPNGVRLAVGAVQITDNNISAATFTGSGENITNLNASNISSGTLNNARLPQNISVSGIVTANTFSGNLQNTLTLNTSGTGLSGSATFNNSTNSTFTVTSNATSDNTNSTIVARNGSGGFSAGIVTATFVGNLTGNLNSSGVNTATIIIGTTANYTNISGTNLNYTGISTATNVRSITLNNTGVGTITTLNSTAGIITNLNVSGVTTTSILNVGVGGTVITTTASGFIGINTINPQSTLSVGGTITELYAGQYWNVVTQADVGYGASQVPLNQYLGQLAFLDDISPNGLRRDGGGEDDVTVNSFGFVGIGTTNAIVTLDVRGNALVSGAITATTFVGALSGTATSTVNIPNLTGDVTSNNTVTTLATVNSNVGTFGGTGAIPVVTVNGKGLVTGVTTVAPNNGTLTLSVSGTGLSGSASFTANQSGNSTFTVTSNATSDNTNSTIVSRNGSGGFSAGIVTATFVGNLTGNLNSSGVNTAATISGTTLTYTNGSITNISGTNLNYIGISTVTNVRSTTLNNTGVGTITTLNSTTGTITNLSGTNISYSGIGTVGSLNIGSTQVISSGRQLQNIASLDATTTATIETAIANAPNTFTDLQVTGLSTFTNGPVLIGSGTPTGTANQRLQVTGDAYVSNNFGIGSTNPQYKLDVNGNLAFLPNGDGFITGSDSSANGLTGAFLMIASSSSNKNVGLHLRGGTIATVDWSIYQDGADNSLRIRRDDSVEPFVIKNIGDVGIGTTNPTSKLHVVGDVLVSGAITSTDYNSASDINLKENIKPISDPIDKVMNITGVSFNWKAGGKSSMGVIAQEIEKVMPEIVSGGDSKTVNYNGLIGLLIEVVKEQQKEINTLKEKIK